MEGEKVPRVPLRSPGRLEDWRKRSAGVGAEISGEGRARFLAMKLRRSEIFIAPIPQKRASSAGAASCGLMPLRWS